MPTKPHSTTRKSNRAMNSSAKQKEAHHRQDAALNAANNRRRQKKRQQDTQAQQEEENQLVHCSGDSAKIKDLKDKNSELMEQRNAFERELQALKEKVPQVDTEPRHGDPEDYDRPRNLSNTSVRKIRQLLGLGDIGDKLQDARWQEIRGCIRDRLLASHIDPNKGLKKTDTKRISRFYAAVEEYEPALKKFELSWPIEYVAKEFASNHRGHKSRKKRRLEHSSESDLAPQEISRQSKSSTHTTRQRPVGISEQSSDEEDSLSVDDDQSSSGGESEKELRGQELSDTDDVSGSDESSSDSSAEEPPAIGTKR
ncbi:hypothetical protein AAF712_016192, partial [Marasmius tenuissimus]